MLIMYFLYIIQITKELYQQKKKKGKVIWGYCSQKVDTIFYNISIDILNYAKLSSCDQRNVVFVLVHY